MSDLPTHSCRLCRHFRKETESWEMPHIYWYECRARPAMANLRSFPFKKTTCPKWEPRKEARHA